MIASVWALLQGGQAVAVGSPATFPVRDVMIVYSIAGVADREVLWVAPGLHLQRVDAPGGMLSVVTDLDAGRMTVIDRAKRSMTVLPAPRRTVGPFGAPTGGAGLVRAGVETVAGISCTDWDVPRSAGDQDGAPTLVCLDADGDTLRLVSGDVTLAQAISVSHAPLEARLFAPPADFNDLPSQQTR